MAPKKKSRKPAKKKKAKAAKASKKAKAKPARAPAPLPAPTAAAAPTQTNGATSASASFKNFRHHPDMENFFRFIYENDLRYEALEIIDEILEQKRKMKLAKATRARTH